MALIVVSGALGAALRFPVLSLDPIKEALADTGAPGATEKAVTAVRSVLSL